MPRTTMKLRYAPAIVTTGNYKKNTTSTYYRTGDVFKLTTGRATERNTASSASKHK